VKGRKLYKNFYEPEDHTEIADYLEEKRNAKWVVSYDDVAEIREAYEGFSPITYYLNYSAGQKTFGKEVIFVSDALTAPNMQGFKAVA
jgi:DNA adenine methylase